MLSIGAMRGGHANYYLKLAQEDYYLEGGEPPGYWLGRGVRSVGLTSKNVEKGDLTALFLGFSPDGEKLVQNAGKANRQPGWDLTFSAPKSVSVVWSQVEGQEQREIEAAHKAAVQAAIEFLESHHSFSRVGKRGSELVSASLVVAAFEHSCSRALDPQLHTHCLVMNLGVDQDGVARSILSKPLYEAKMVAGSFYRAELGYELQRRLGVDLERPIGRDGQPVSWFEVAGVPEELLKHFSKRRMEIEVELGARGLESASAAAFAALSTRKAKDVVPPRRELHDSWRREGREFRFSPAAIFRGPREEGVLRPSDVSGAIHEATELLTFSENFFSYEELLRKTLDATPGRGLSAASVARAVRDELDAKEAFVSLGTRNGSERWTTSDVLAVEKAFLQSASELRRREFSAVPHRIVDRVLEKDRGEEGRTFELDDEQKAAVSYITQGKESIKVIAGFAGTGKTDMLAAAREALEQGGYRVIGAALAGVAARTLQEKTGIQSATVRMRELQIFPGLTHRLKHHMRQLVRAAAGKRTYKLDPLRIDEKTVLIIDEAGMVGTRDFALLAQAVVDGGGSLVAVGDEKQLSSIERGGVFAKLVRDVPGIQLREIRRQADTQDRAAVKDLANGNPEAALAHYAEKGQLCVAESREAAEYELVTEWEKNGGSESPGEHKIFAGTRSEVARLNNLAQWSRVRAGRVNPNERVEHGNDVFMVGDRVRFNTSLRTLGIKKGEGGTVIAVKDGLTGKYVAVARGDSKATLSERTVAALKHHATQLIRAALGQKTERHRPRKDVVLVPLKSINPSVKPYAGLSLDYAMTTHLGQGQTVTNAYVLLGGKMTDRELTYVQGSRHREGLFLYTSEREAGRSLAKAAQETRPVPGRERTADDEVPKYSQLIMQMKLSRAKELAHAFIGQPSLSQEEHEHAQQ